MVSGVHRNSREVYGQRRRLGTRTSVCDVDGPGVLYTVYVVQKCRLE